MINPETIHKHNAEELRNSGIYPIANLELFKAIKELEFSEWCLEREEEVIHKYKSYLNNILSMKKNDIDDYLKLLKIQEIMELQLLEQEDSYSLAIQLHSKKENAIDYLLKGKEAPHELLTRDKIIKSHKKLLEGTSSQNYAEKNYRTDNEAFVGRRQDGNIIIRYFTLDYHDIEEAIMNLTIYYNSKMHDEHLFFKPIILHGLTGTLQMFDDGNTRFGRVLQNVKTYELTSKNLSIYLPNPTIFVSRSYKDYRDQYREKLANIVIEPGMESWDKWIDFNLNRIEDQIYYTNNKLEEYKYKKEYYN